MNARRFANRASGRVIGSALCLLLWPSVSRAGEVEPLVTERVIPASVDEVWAAFTTKEGMESWMVARAEVDLRVGGKVRTTYKKDAEIGDASTIENTILAFEPKRMLSLKATKVPEGFPFRKAMENVWSVAYFDAISASRTRVRVVGLGYDDSEESRQMRSFFETGNATTLEHLQRKFAGRKTSEEEASRGVSLLKRLVGEWIHENKQPDGRIFRVRNSIRPGPDGVSLVSDGWLGDASGMFYHGVTQIYRRPETEGGGLWFQNVNEKGALAEGEIRVGSGDSLVWEWNVQELDGKTASYHIEMVLESADTYRMKMKQRSATGEWMDRVDIVLRRVEEVPTEFKRMRPAAGSSTSGGAGPQLGGFESPEFQSYLAHIHAAHSSLRLEEASAAQGWLSAAPEAFRGWEWRFLKSMADQSLATQVVGSAVYSMAVSPDGTWIATGTADGSIRLSDLRDFSLKRQLTGHEAAVYKVAISPDGKLIASASHDKTARVWSVETGEQVMVFSKHTNPVAAVAFHPNGRTIASAAYERLQTPEGVKIEGRVYLWDATAGELVAGRHTLTAGAKPLSALEFSRDGRRLAAGSLEGAAFVWDLDKGDGARAFAVPEEGLYHAVDAVALSPDGKLVAAGSKDHTVRVWDVDTGEQVAVLRGHGEHVYAVAFAPDGRSLATGAADDTIRVWATADWAPTGVLHGHTGAVRCLQWIGEGRRILSGGADGTIRSWRPPTTPRDHLQMQASDACYASIFSLDMAVIYSCSYDGRIGIWDADTGEKKTEWKAHDSSCNTLGLSHDGLKLMSCSWDKTVKIWDPSSRKLVATLENEAGVYHAAISRDGTRVVAAQGKAAQVWDAQSGQRLARLEGHEAGIQSVAIGPDGSMIATASSDKTVRLWKMDGEAVVKLTGHTAPVESVVFSADGTLLASAGHEGMVHLWDVAGRKHLRKLHQEDGKLFRVGFAPDGKRVVAAGDRLVVLNVERGGTALSLRPHNDGVWFAAFAADGDRLVSCSWDRTIAVLDARPPVKRFAAEEKAAENHPK